MRLPFSTLALATMLAATQACSDDARSVSAADEVAAKQAKVAYLAGINSNNLNQFLATITDDAVFVAPNTPALVGKTAVGEWVKGYLDAYQTTWEKHTEEFVVRGDLAYERYSYKSVDTPRTGGPVAGTPVVTDRGNGLNIYRRGTDGAWKLARDSWASAGVSADSLETRTSMKRP